MSVMRPELRIVFRGYSNSPSTSSTHHALAKYLPQLGENLQHFGGGGLLSLVYPQSELTLAFGIGGREKADRVAIESPSGVAEEYKNVAAGAHVCWGPKGIDVQ